MDNNSDSINKKNWERYLVEMVAEYLIKHGLKDDKKALERFKIEIGNLDKKKGLFMHYGNHKYKKNNKSVLIKLNYNEIMEDNSYRSDEEEKYLERFFDKLKLTDLSELKYGTNEYIIVQTVNRLLSRLRIIKAEIEELKNPKVEVKETHSLNDEPTTTIHKRSKFTPITPEEIEKRHISDKEYWLDKNASQIIEGPKANSLFGRDNNTNAIGPMYALAEDILTLMMMDQDVEERSNSDVIDITTVSTPYDSYKEKLAKSLFAKYGVNDLDQLLNKYGKIRDAYYKKFVKLNEEARKAYAFEKSYGIFTVLEHYSSSSAMEAENFSFPPSKEELIEMMNRRIISAEKYKDLPFPKLDKDNTSARENDYREYVEVKKYFENLTKNMNPEDIARLYTNAKVQLRGIYRYVDYKDKNYNYENLREAILQRMFAEIIFSKEGKRYVDDAQLQTEIQRIAKEYFNEDLEFSYTGKMELTEEDKKERANKVFEEFQKHEEHCKATKQKPMSLEEFAREKFGISNMKEIEHLIDGVNKQR